MTTKISEFEEKLKEFLSVTSFKQKVNVDFTEKNIGDFYSFARDHFSYKGVQPTLGNKMQYVRLINCLLKRLNLTMKSVKNKHNVITHYEIVKYEKSDSDTDDDEKQTCKDVTEYIVQIDKLKRQLEEEKNTRRHLEQQIKHIKDFLSH